MVNCSLMDTFIGRRMKNLTAYPNSRGHHCPKNKEAVQEDGGQNTTTSITMFQCQSNYFSLVVNDNSCYRYYNAYPFVSCNLSVKLLFTLETINNKVTSVFS